MFEWRNLIGVLSLVIASAGPMPLWLHHAVHHAAGECCATDCGHASDCLADSHSHNDESNQDDCHAGQSHSASQVCANSSADDSHGEPRQPASAVVDRPHLAAPSTTYLASSGHGHDCGICYQLSQAASVAMVVGQQSASVTAIPLATRPRQFAAAIICTLCAPRGPPAAAA